MNALLQRIRAAGMNAWLRFVRILNWVAVSSAGAVLVVNATYPQVVASIIGGLPVAAKIIGMALWGLLVDRALHSAGKAK